MKDKIKKLYKKYHDLIPYVIFGVFTTLVNYLAYWLCTRILLLSTMPSTIISWFLAVFFAYITNRKIVFHSEAKTFKEITKEIISFFLCRIATGIVDWGCMFLCVDILHWNDLVMKLLANFIVIALNYIASKLVIFSHKKKRSIVKEKK